MAEGAKGLLGEWGLMEEAGTCSGSDAQVLVPDERLTPLPAGLHPAAPEMPLSPNYRHHYRRTLERRSRAALLLSSNTG